MNTRAHASASHELDPIRERFDALGQAHVFDFWDRLDPAGRARLLAQASALAPDLEALIAAQASAVASLSAGTVHEFEPMEAVALPEHGGDETQRLRAREVGEALLASGRVAVMVVAGGQGTRLGFPHPKGAFPIGPVSGRTLFGLQAQKIAGLARKSGRAIPWYVMTSDATDAATRALFETQDCFARPSEDVFLFRQGMLPAFDFEARLILERPDRIFESPNGHGGSLTALLSSGALTDMERRGIDTIFYYQVDNPLVAIADPVFLGLHSAADAEMSCKVIRKPDPDVKWGVVARIDGRPGIVEYTELDDTHRNQRDADGELVYWAGSPAIHVLDTKFVRRVAEQANDLLPLHASAKKIPTVNGAGESVTPDSPNGYKLERFVFDALPAAARVCIVETRLAEEFSPVKNAEGPESPESARRDLIAAYRRWLEAAGLELPPATAAIEIDHEQIDGPEDAISSGWKAVEDAGGAICVAAAAGNTP